MISKSDKSLLTPISLFIGAILVLLTVGIVFIYSASSVYALEKLGSTHYFAKKHLFGLLIGLCAMMIVQFIPVTFIRRMIPFLFLLSLLLTGATRIPFLSRTIHGSSRWLRLGPLIFQPSELLKYAFVVYIAYFFSKIPNKISFHKRLPSA